MGERINPVAHLVAGGFAGVCRRVVMQPFDTVKVRMQATEAGRQKLYSNSFHCFWKTLRIEGVRGLYKGVTMMILSDAPLSAIYFFGASVARHLQKDATSKESIRVFFVAGCLGSAMTSIIVAPVERIKILLQVDHKDQTTPRQVAKQLLQRDGIRGFYRGTVATLCRDIPSGGIYLATYVLMKRYLISVHPQQARDPLSLFPTIIAGGVAGLVAAALGMPSDVVQSRLQTAPDRHFPYGMRYMVKELFKSGGVAAFYRGFTPIALYAFPGSAACMFGYEMALNVWKEILP